jgi:hypothetical protein
LVTVMQGPAALAEPWFGFTFLCYSHCRFFLASSI